jgi:hypothetical protein
VSVSVSVLVLVLVLVMPPSRLRTCPEGAIASQPRVLTLGTAKIAVRPEAEGATG